VPHIVEVTDCEGVPEFETVGLGVPVGDDERLFVFDKVWVSEAVCDDDDDGVTVGDCVELIVDDGVCEDDGVCDGTHTTGPAAESSDTMPATTFRRPPPIEKK
jgi:hypothetical protein